MLFCFWLIISALHVALPTPETPILFYSNQTRQDIKWVFHHALQQATHHIFLSVYGITDPAILSLLSKKLAENVNLYVEYDPSASSDLKKILPPPAVVTPIKCKGLMHRKILSLDHERIFLGSANLTSTSLRHHDNLVLGLYSPSLAQFLECPTTCHFSFDLGEQRGEIFLLSDSEHMGLQHLITSLKEAKRTIRIAMFTLTHPEIAKALIDARKRGVLIHIAVDYYTAKGASKKTLATLEKAGITILQSQGKQLLHHKWALLDDRLLIIGSANWTKAAFSKNRDFLFFLSPLNQKQLQFMHHLWRIIDTESL